ncbi:hypothetical protein L5G28_07610 [Gordonia sp. HY285]|uniref:hypothetical protein n=1 Tax=Gordonia liuliyuniae TaxID=2911517 RepID=UPI001F42D72F|nr:hypothetical protein [Gordonia liuliyuniae]MCF8610027.1 hypothetical protein [Gordonia liuliyuniae]
MTRDSLAAIRTDTLSTTTPFRPTLGFERALGDALISAEMEADTWQIPDDPIDTGSWCSTTATFTVTDVNPAAVWLLTGLPSLRRPRMKHRALRRRLGYTRTGRTR